MAADISPEEEAEVLRHDIVALLSRDPRHWFAQVLGQRLMDLAADL